ncbi:MAG: lamin tail domain-containing protein [Clostridia bacterium]|nr:lamin tail domain-containing protein [Clostridia bacterium]
MPAGFAGLLIACAVLVAVCIGLQFIFPNGIHLATNTGEEVAASAMVSQIYSNGPVRINEIMTSNQKTLALADGSSPDWIEITNTGNNSVNLKGYSLSKTADSVSIFTFPDMTLQPGGCMLLYADSKLSETVEKEMHVPFRLSSAGDTLMLFNAGRTAIDTVNIPAVNGDHSYMRVDNSHWEVSDKPTPGAENTEANYLAMKQKAAYSPVVFSEVMAVNDTAYAAQDGMYYDYIELHNVSSDTVNLGGWYLSDDVDYTRKWRIPDDTTVAPGEYVIVFASGLDMREDLTQLHANFSLSSEGETLTLCDSNGAIMDQVAFDLMKSNIAYALQADGSWTNTGATPNAAN